MNKKTNKPVRETSVTVVLSAKEKGNLAKAAQAEGRTMCGLVRHLLRDVLGGEASSNDGA